MAAWSVEHSVEKMVAQREKLTAEWMVGQRDDCSAEKKVVRKVVRWVLWKDKQRAEQMVGSKAKRLVVQTVG